MPLINFYPSSTPLLKFDEPLFKVYHDATLFGDGTRSRPLRVLGGAIPSQTGNAGEFLTTDGTTLSWSAVASGGVWGSITGTLTNQTDLNTALGLKLNTSAFVPAGSNTQIQFNNSSAFGASANLTWNGTTLNIGASATVARESIKGDGTNPISSFEGSNGTDGWTISAAGTSILPKVTATHLIGGASNTVSQIYTGMIRGGASSNWQIGAIAGGMSGFLRVAQSHDWNAQPGTWLFDYTSTNGNNSTSGTGAHVAIIGAFKPTSGTAVYSDIAITSAYNQTGGANGQVRGIYINPTFTTATGIGYMAIESTAGQHRIADATVAVTGSLAGSLLNLTQTWNTSGNPTSIFLNVTNTGSGAAAKLIDLQVGGATMFNVSKAGLVTTASSIVMSAGDMTIAGGSQLRWAARGNIDFQSDGVMKFGDSANTSFGRLQFGGTTSSFPSLKRSGTGLVVRLADDSADSDITAAKVISTNIVRLKGYTVSTLPAGVVGDTAYATDLLTPTFGTTAVGGGAVVGRVFYNGTNWIT